MDITRRNLLRSTTAIAAVAVMGVPVMAALPYEIEVVDEGYVSREEKMRRIVEKQRAHREVHPDGTRWDSENTIGRMSFECSVARRKAAGTWIPWYETPLLVAMLQSSLTV